MNFLSAQQESLRKFDIVWGNNPIAGEIGLHKIIEIKDKEPTND